MNDELSSFTPDWLVLPPGATISDILEERGWTQKELASRLDFTPKHVNLLIKGKAAINEETALKLERVLGSTVGFWLSREARYREALTRRHEFTALKPYVGWLKQLPVSDMIRFGWVDCCSDKPQQVAACLRFFGVASVEVWEEKWMRNLAAFRSPTIQEKHKGAVAAWIRACECQAQTVFCQPYDAQKFKEILCEARKLTREQNIEILIKTLKKLCAEAGVALSVVPAPKGCPAHGATCWLAPDKALLMLSDRYKTNDQFWFSFFHEAAHILHHAKKIFYIDTEGQLGTEEEAEANYFATHTLIPAELVKHIQQIPRDFDSIKKFARSLDIAPGIVVGRMQNDGLIPWKSALNSLKTKIELSQ